LFLILGIYVTEGMKKIIVALALACTWVLTQGVYIALYVNMPLGRRYQSLSDVVSRAFASAGIPATRSRLAW